MDGKSLTNAMLFIEYDRVLGHLFCFDDFAKEKIVYKCPPWDKVKEFKPRQLLDSDITHLAAAL